MSDSLCRNFYVSCVPIAVTIMTIPLFFFTLFKQKIQSQPRKSFRNIINFSSGLLLNIHKATHLVFLSDPTTLKNRLVSADRGREQNGTQMPTNPPAGPCSNDANVCFVFCVGCTFVGIKPVSLGSIVHYQVSTLYIPADDGSRVADFLPQSALN